MGLKWTTQRTIDKLVNKHEPFLLGNVSAILVKQGEQVDCGRLGAIWAIEDIITKSRESDLYVVYSYKTPIGWVKTDNSGDTWTVPDIYYSPSTKHHQNVLAASI